ncbi:type I-E CRISPR-associated protein Cse1/CasA [Streptomyces longispororuber]|uniref:type I-E CRISPR-associated protein Cse1/CasA n=1 Tax=Streptomyces longispororuber TaxID=68230 RepID=UPI00210A71DA|nr:type I-E CRISPR-associated protein Cse1/CasA [Streptomyces longispororuber]MCQ4210397.1 type I-E CRISPR-associated protein Cse1/CasA [Streptomyces longispororuber]
MTTPLAEGEKPSFDLTTRPWIPVLDLPGAQHDLSLREVFAQAGRLRRIVGDLPTQEFALLRLLLAVAHDALNGPPDVDAWADLWEDEYCFAPVAAYLDRHRDRFDLLSQETPFFQTAGLRTSKDEVFSLNRIVADVPNGEPFFSARLPAVDRLTFAEAARWIVHAHAYDTSGIKTGAVGDSRAKGGKVYPLGVGWTGNLGGIFVEGATLRETLLLNLLAADAVHFDIDPDDVPAWRRAVSGPGGGERPPTGIRDLYTWQSRRLRLHFDEGGVTGVVLGYGDPLHPRNRHSREPMTAWRRSPAQEKKLGQGTVYLPREHDPERAAWRGMAALLTGQPSPGTAGSEPAAVLRPLVLEWVAQLVTEGILPRGYLVRARIVGARYGTQQSVIDEVVDDYVAMALVLLHQRDRRFADQAIAAVADADVAVNALADLASNLAWAAGLDSEPRRSMARAHAYGAFEQPYRSWLYRLAESDDPYGRREAWQREVFVLAQQLGDHLLAAAGDAAWVGRVVDLKKGPEWLNSALADGWFRGALRKGLGITDSSDLGASPARAGGETTSDTAAEASA